MQEKTLEEEFKEQFPIINFASGYVGIDTHANIKAFILIAVEKAREEGNFQGYKERQEEEKDFIKDNYKKWKEEGRKEGYAQGKKFKHNPLETCPDNCTCEGRGELHAGQTTDDIITKYKEELLGKLSTFEIKEIGLKYDDNVKDTVREIVDMTL
jgi:hypothetical protein